MKYKQQELENVIFFLPKTYINDMTEKWRQILGKK